MFNKVKLILSNREIILKILITFALLLVFKAGTYIPVPLFTITSVKKILSSSFLTVLNTFSGGGLSNFSILALGISPYITASIVIQMMQMVIPKFKEWAESGEVGKQKLNRVTRYTTVGIAMIQALLIIFSLGNGNPQNILVTKAVELNNVYWLLYIYMAIVITAGSAFTMWLADLITRHGIGNGSSLIITAGIVSSIPSMFSILSQTYLESNFSALNLFLFILIVVLYVGMILAVVFFEGAVRKIPVQYANQAGKQSSDIPVKLNSASVIPVIFASTILSIPMTIIGVLKYSESDGVGFWFNQIFSTSKPIGIALYIVLIIFFSYFYSFMQVDPEQIADNLEKQGAFIPGYRLGEDTKVQLSKMLFRITTIGAVYLVVLALVPIVVSLIFGFTSSVITIGGTSLIIIVGVAIETFRQIETTAETKDYKGFLN